MLPLRRVLQHAQVMDGSSDHESLSLLMRRNPITEQDLNEAIATMNYSTSVELSSRYEKWESSHGSS